MLSNDDNITLVSLSDIVTDSTGIGVTSREHVSVNHQSSVVAVIVASQAPTHSTYPS